MKALRHSNYPWAWIKPTLNLRYSFNLKRFKLKKTLDENVCYGLITNMISRVDRFLLWEARQFCQTIQYLKFYCTTRFCFCIKICGYVTKFYFILFHSNIILVFLHHLEFFWISILYFLFNKNEIWLIRNVIEKYERKLFILDPHIKIDSGEWMPMKKCQIYELNDPNST